MAPPRTCECNECKTCKKRTYQARYAAKHRASESLRSRTTKQKRKNELSALKLADGCALCGYNKSAKALHYHHRDPADKEFCVADSVMYAWSRITAEIAKCDVLCANCHAEQH